MGAVSQQPDQEKLETLRQWLLLEWASALGQSIESMTGERTAFTASRDAYVPSDGALVWEETLSLGEDHILAVSFPEAAWQATGRGALVAIGLEDPDPASIRGTFLEIIRQATSVVIRSIGVRLGREVTSLDGRDTDASASSSGWLRVEGSRNGEDLSHGIFVSPAVLTSLLPPEPSEKPAEPPRSSAPPASEGRYPPTLDLLLDVELPVSVSFGRAQVPLKEVLKLTSGSIVELNRTISDPVEVIVNNCVIARGEVVVVEGNYGIRINQIVNRQERLRTLH